MLVKIEGIEMLEAIDGYVPEQARVILIVNRDTPEQRADIERLVAYKEQIGGALAIDIVPVEEGKEGSDA